MMAREAAGVMSSQREASILAAATARTAASPFVTIKIHSDTCHLLQHIAPELHFAELIADSTQPVLYVTAHPTSA
jgi:hypothetical protein